MTISLTHLARHILRRLKRPDIRAIVCVPRRAELPDPLKPRTLYLVGQPVQWAMFLCPCNQGHDIALALGRAGHWYVDATGRRPSVTPSVNSMMGGTRCHYWITNGRVRWCPDTTKR